MAFFIGGVAAVFIAEGVFSTFRSFPSYLIREVDTDVRIPTLKFSVGWGWVCNRMY